MIVVTVELACINSDKLRDGAECVWHLGGRKMSKSVCSHSYQFIDSSIGAVLFSERALWHIDSLVLFCCAVML